MKLSPQRPKKELEDFNFRLQGTYNVDDILNIALNFDKEWDLYTSRQKEVYPDRVNPHLYTNTYIIQNHPLDWVFESSIQSQVLDSKALSSLSHIIESLEEELVGKAARVLLIKLEANKEVATHVDNGDYLSTVRRFHIPLITNDLVSYTVNNETIHMKKSECWEINNLKYHSVRNDGDEDRIHLLIDIMPEYAFRIYDDNLDKNIRIIENFIKEEEANFFIDYINKNKDDKSKFPLTRGEVRGKVRSEANIPELVTLKKHKEILEEIKDIAGRTMAEFKDISGKEDLCTSAFWMTRLGPNTVLPMHKDNHKFAEHLYMSGVIYLNEDYEGGYIKFKDVEITYKPKKYSAIFFPSSYQHTVTRVRSGIRMTLPNWVSIGQERDMFVENPIVHDPRTLFGSDSDDPALPVLLASWAKANNTTIAGYDGTEYAPGVLPPALAIWAKENKVTIPGYEESETHG